MPRCQQRAGDGLAGEMGTVTIEIGMQNSGLGVMLANQFLQLLSALPETLFSL